MLRRIKLTIFGASWLVGGVAFYIGPGGWGDLQYHREIGIGLFVIGALLLAALTLRSAMRLFQALLFATIAAGCGWAAFLAPVEAWQTQNLVFAGIALLALVNIPIAFLGGYDFTTTKSRKSLERETAEDLGKKGLKELLED